MEPVTYYVVRTPGDGDYEFFEENPVDLISDEVNYDQADIVSAKLYADTLDGGYVVKVTEEIV